ncbi:MAG: YggN family protein [Paraglaciecola sp.]|nr:YggN family protein [Paraglaciecola sp.]
MRTLLLAGLLTLTTTTYAAANECDISFEGSLQLEKSVLSIETDDHSKIVINQANQLFVNGEKIALSRYQQRLVSDYYAGIYAAAPQAAAIASDAIKLASVTVNEVFYELLGGESDAINDLTSKLDELGDQIHMNFYASNGEIRLNSDSFNDGSFLGQDWEDEFENVIEQVVSNSMGHLLISIGSEILFSGGDMDAFERKMERFGQSIEQRVEFQSSALEARADSLCLSLVAIDEVEEKLQDSISALSDLDVVQIKTRPQAM